MRLEYSPTALACRAISTRSLRAVGSAPEKWICSTPISDSSVKTFFHSSVVSSLPPRSSSTGLEQYGHCSGQRWVISASTASGMPNVSAVERRCSMIARLSAGSAAIGLASVSVGLMSTSWRVLRRRLLLGLRQKCLVGEILQHGDCVGADGVAVGGIFFGEQADDVGDAAHAIAEF